MERRLTQEQFTELAGIGVDFLSLIAIMRRMNIKKAFTFDQHFRTAGFEILR